MKNEYIVLFPFEFELRKKKITNRLSLGQVRVDPTQNQSSWIWVDPIYFIYFGSENYGLGFHVQFGQVHLLFVFFNYYRSCKGH